jgi:hypothetical protein
MSECVRMFRWRCTGGKWSRWHLVTNNRMNPPQITWCGLRVRYGVFPKHDETQSKDWRGERDGTCKSCLYQLDTHGAKVGLHRKENRKCRTGINR